MFISSSSICLSDLPGNFDILLYFLKKRSDILYILNANIKYHQNGRNSVLLTDMLNSLAQSRKSMNICFKIHYLPSLQVSCCSLFLLTLANDSLIPSMFCVCVCFSELMFLGILFGKTLCPGFKVLSFGKFLYLLFPDAWKTLTTGRHTKRSV